MKTKRLIRTSYTLLFLLLLFDFGTLGAVTRTGTTSISGEQSVKENSREVIIRNIRTIGSDRLSTEANIVRMEYFFDTDPGYGNGTSVEFTPDTEVALEKTIPVNTLSEGIHIFYIRACDDEGHWSQTYNRIFLKTPLQNDNFYNITKVEYFFDADRGFGKGIASEFTAASDIVLDKIWSVNSLVEGIHILYVRVQDEFGHWSETYNKIFLKTRMQTDDLYNIVKVEYFFDVDPGYGKGITSEFSAGSNIILDKIWPVNSLNEGIHILYVRVLDQPGHWSETYNKVFLKTRLQTDNSFNITEVEYFFDNDPGYGNGVKMEISQNDQVTVEHVIPVDDLNYGIHHLYVRGKDANKKWSQLYQRTFLKYQGHNIVKVEYFFDEDPGYGNGTDLPVSPSEIVIIDDVLDIQSLSTGTHMLNVRALSENNLWSDVYTYSITVLLTDVNDLANSKTYIIVYPNPTKGLLNIEVNKITEPLKIQVVSANGSILLTKEFYIDGNATFDLSSFSNGVYILRFIYNNEVRTQNIVLNK